ncbi:NYN domain-containing protein [Gemmatimonas groenlandica]|nr:NYN domain-containing protein [Gemmatimonas groenlandica]
MTSPNAAPPAHAPNAALLIDFDNVTMGIRSDLQGELNNLLSSDIVKGKVAVRRAYADWRRYPQYIVPLTESSIDLIFAPAYGSSKKNATDIRLAIDAMELVFTRPEIGTFVLLSGDSDFSSMVIKLKEYGKYVIGVGIRESSSDLLVMNCDEYYSYNALAGLTKTGDDESTRWDPWELVTESVNRMKRNGDVMRSDRLKQVMQEIDSSFDEKNLGMPKFSRFVQDASHKGLLKVTKLDSGQLEIDTPDGSIAPASSASAAAPAEPRREESDRERDERRGRRGRRGRGRDRFDRTPVDGEVRDATQDAADAEHDAADDAAEAAELVSFAPLLDSAAVDVPAEADATGEPGVDAAADAAGEVEREARRGRNRRGRGRDRFRDREGREPRAEADAAAQADGEVAPAADADVPAVPVVAAPVFVAPVAATPAAATPTFGSAVAGHIGSSGERLTRSEAFDLVRRAVEALVQGDDSTSASAARTKAFELLGRDSESLSSRMFERILQDAHDANMIDLRRRGNDFEVARAADAASIVEQLKTVDDAQKAEAKAAAALLPQAPRGMGARGVAPRGGSRGRAPAGPPADLLMFGVVGARPVGAVAPATNGTTAAAPVAPVAVSPVAAPTAPVVVEAPSVPAAPTAPARGRGAKPAAKKETPVKAAPAKSAPAKSPAPAKKAVAKAPAKAAPKAAKAPAKAAKPAAKAPAPAAKKAAAKAPAKKAAKKR